MREYPVQYRSIPGPPSQSQVYVVYLRQRERNETGNGSTIAQCGQCCDCIMPTLCQCRTSYGNAGSDVRTSARRVSFLMIVSDSKVCLSLCRQIQSDTLCCGAHYETYISISPYHTLCCCVHYVMYIAISTYHTLCCGVHYVTYIAISPYHTLCCGFHCLTYIGISP